MPHFPSSRCAVNRHRRTPSRSWQIRRFWVQLRKTRRHSWIGKFCAGRCFLFDFSKYLEFVFLFLIILELFGVVIALCYRVLVLILPHKACFLVHLIDHRFVVFVHFFLSKNSDQRILVFKEVRIDLTTLIATSMVSWPSVIVPCHTSPYAPAPTFLTIFTLSPLSSHGFLRIARSSLTSLLTGIPDV